MLTMYDDDDSVLAAVRAGACGYVLKGADPEDLQQAMRGVSAGQAVFGEGLARRVLDLLTSPHLQGPPLPELTERERQVLDLMATGMGNASIAHRLGISPNTVANHASSIVTKLQVSNRVNAITKARSAGLGADGAPAPTNIADRVPRDPGPMPKRSR
jgi:DNA-binding NarL/FixJ family response regulator